MEKNNYFIPFLIFLALAIIFAVVAFVNVAPECPSCETCKTCSVCEICPEEKALMEGVLGSWGENLYDSSEYLINVDITNYGYKEGKNIEVTCKIYNSDEYGVQIGDSAVGTITKSIGNVASISYKSVELSTEKSSKMGQTPTAVCFISNCDDCEILYKRIPELADAFDKA